MLKLTANCTILFLLLSCASSPKGEKTGKWLKLFDGKTMKGWRVNENPETFKVEDGNIVVNGLRSHLFYNGPVMNHDFKNFELKLRIMTFPGANSGVYFHTRFQDNGWPSKGLEVQVNNSHADWRRTASLYGIRDVKEVFVKDNEWFDMHIIVQGRKVTVKLNDRIVNEYTEPDNLQPEKGNEDRVVSGGTFALQGHDPESKILYKEVMLKVN